MENISIAEQKSFLRKRAKDELKKYFEDDSQVGYVVTSADGVLCTESAWDRGWESYIAALETELNGCHKRWYHLTREWKNGHPEEYEHYLKLKKNIKKQEQAEQYRLHGWKSVNIRPHDLRYPNQNKIQTFFS